MLTLKPIPNGEAVADAIVGGLLVLAVVIVAVVVVLEVRGR